MGKKNEGVADLLRHGHPPVFLQVVVVYVEYRAAEPGGHDLPDGRLTRAGTAQ